MQDFTTGPAAKTSRDRVMTFSREPAMSDQTASKKGHQRPVGAEPALDESISVEPTVGWHCTHSFYQFDRARLAQLTDAERTEGLVAFREALNEESASSPTRLQKWIVPGHKADFAV
ncbi:MAG TPA: hypothetical protein DEB70_00550, partial [Planctomycetaceae bacterium]|nr:hypothetical protein [Planctomycetaceae bacterium]